MWKIVFLLILSSCQLSLTRREVTKDQLRAPSLVKSVDESVKTPYFAYGEWPDREWWHRFNDSNLNCIVKAVLCNNPSLHAKKKKVVEAKEEAVMQFALLFPWATLNMQAGEMYNSQNGLYRAFNPNLPLYMGVAQSLINITFDFDIWGKYKNLYAAALGVESARFFEVEEVELKLTQWVVSAYFTLKALLEQKILFRTLLEIREKIVHLAKLQYTHAFSSLFPLYQTEEALERIKQQVASNQYEIDAVTYLINNLMGRSPDCPLEVTPSLKALEKAIDLPCNVTIGLLGRRPDIRAKIMYATALSKKVGAAIADFYPDLSLSAFLGFQSNALSALYQWPSSMWQVLPAITLPLFTAGSIGANVRAKKADFDAAIFDYNQTLLDSAKEVATKLAETRALFTEQEEQARITTLLDAEFLLMRSKVEAKIANLFSFYLSEESYLEAKIKNYHLIGRQYALVAELIASLGGGFGALR